jgi:hypothetical protein
VEVQLEDINVDKAVGTGSPAAVQIEQTENLEGISEKH